MDTPTTPLPSISRPWSAWVAWTLLVVLVLVAGPLFVCTPPWCDVTHYDLAARNVVRGGVHYRDVFDTNLPGMVWLHVLVRAALGWGLGTLRLVDLALVTAMIALLLPWIRGDTPPSPPSEGGDQKARRAWTALALALFYFSTLEVCHCQRDGWMLLPALGALALRARQVEGRGTFALAGVEGVLWAVAFWIKPFIAVPAVTSWLVSLAVRRRATNQPRLARLGVELLGLLLGSGLVFAAGLFWLRQSGAWPHFFEIVRTWLPTYAARSNQLEVRVQGPLIWVVGAFPWSVLVLLALPAACFAVVRAARARPEAPDAEREDEARRGLFGAFFLGWLVQAVLLQHPNIYVLMPLVFLAAPLLAGWSWPTGRLRVALVVLFFAVALIRHPLRHTDRLETWLLCIKQGSTPGLRDRLSLMDARSLGRTHWRDLEGVRAFLDLKQVQDGEVTCYHNATHPLYLTMNLEPSTRFLQFTMVLNAFPDQQELVRAELAASRQRFVVSDLAVLEFEGGTLERLPRTFPWTEPIVFRSGRYLVHEVRGPVGPLQ